MKQNHVDVKEKIKCMLLTCVLAILIAACASICVAAEESSRKKGDLDGDGELSYKDLLILQRYLKSSEELDTVQLDAADIDLNGIVNEDDLYRLLDLLEGQQEKCSEKIWNASEMPLDNLYIYDGLYVLQVDKNNTNKVKVDNSNKSCDGMRFIQCIKTGGDASAVNYVPKSRALKFNTDKPCQMTIYAASGSAKNENPRLLVTKKGVLVSEIPLITGIVQKSTVNLLDSDTYYIYSGQNSGSASIYYIELKEIKGDVNRDGKINERDAEILKEYLNGNVVSIFISEADINRDGRIDNQDLNILYDMLGIERNPEEACILVSVNIEGTVTCYLTAENVSSGSNYVYTVEYDASVLAVSEIGFGTVNNKNGYNIKASDEITILSNANGILKFKVNSNENNWSGIIAPIKFKGLKTESLTEIKFLGKEA